MNLNDILRIENDEDKVYRLQALFSSIRLILNQLFSMAKVFLFWIIMIAILTSPAWIPVLVEGVSIH